MNWGDYNLDATLLKSYSLYEREDNREKKKEHSSFILEFGGGDGVDLINNLALYVLFKATALIPILS